MTKKLSRCETKNVNKKHHWKLVHICSALVTDAVVLFWEQRIIVQYLSTHEGFITIRKRSVYTCHPWADTRRAESPWANTSPPPPADTPLGRHLLGRHPPPPPADGYCSGQYTSYWNAFLFQIFLFVVSCIALLEKHWRYEVVHLMSYSTIINTNTGWKSQRRFPDEFIKSMRDPFLFIMLFFWRHYCSQK